MAADDHMDLNFKQNDSSNRISYNKHIAVPGHLSLRDNQPWTIVDDML